MNRRSRVRNHELSLPFMLSLRALYPEARFERQRVYYERVGSKPYQIGKEKKRNLLIGTTLNLDSATLVKHSTSALRAN
jgi:hypothetical protein